jgi:hypothetical protein
LFGWWKCGALTRLVAQFKNTFKAVQTDSDDEYDAKAFSGTSATEVGFAGRDDLIVANGVRIALVCSEPDEGLPGLMFSNSMMF